MQLDMIEIVGENKKPYLLLLHTCGLYNTFHLYDEATGSPVRPSDAEISKDTISKLEKLFYKHKMPNTVKSFAMWADAFLSELNTAGNANTEKILIKWYDQLDQIFWEYRAFYKETSKIQVKRIVEKIKKANITDLIVDDLREFASDLIEATEEASENADGRIRLINEIPLPINRISLDDWVQKYPQDVYYFLNLYSVYWLILCPSLRKYLPYKKLFKSPLILLIEDVINIRNKGKNKDKHNFLARKNMVIYYILESEKEIAEREKNIKKLNDIYCLN